MLPLKLLIITMPHQNSNHPRSSFLCFESELFITRWRPKITKVCCADHTHHMQLTSQIAMFLGVKWRLLPVKDNFSIGSIDLAFEPEPEEMYCSMGRSCFPIIWIYHQVRYPMVSCRLSRLHWSPSLHKFSTRERQIQSTLWHVYKKPSVLHT